MTKAGTFAVVLVGILAGGCAVHPAEDQQLRDALRERDLASARLVNAINTFCTVNTDTLESRRLCIFEQNLLASRIPQTPGPTPPVRRLDTSAVR